eukprot:6192013-Pleurochrysis_carterae.AAC.1
MEAGEGRRDEAACRARKGTAGIFAVRRGDVCHAVTDKCITASGVRRDDRAEFAASCCCWMAEVGTPVEKAAVAGMIAIAAIARGTCRAAAIVRKARVARTGSEARGGEMKAPHLEMKSGARTWCRRFPAERSSSHPVDCISPLRNRDALRDNRASPRSAATRIILSRRTQHVHAFTLGARAQNPLRVRRSWLGTDSLVSQEGRRAPASINEKKWANTIYSAQRKQNAEADARRRRDHGMSRAASEKGAASHAVVSTPMRPATPTLLHRVPHEGCPSGLQSIQRPARDQEQKQLSDLDAEDDELDQLDLDAQSAEQLAKNDGLSEKPLADPASPISKKGGFLCCGGGRRSNRIKPQQPHAKKRR